MHQQRQNKVKSSEAIDRQVKNKFNLSGKISFDELKLQEKLQGAQTSTVHSQ